MSRLTPEDWIAAGFRALTLKGIQALKAEAIARDLGTTKGSFYWHFKDVPAYKSAMIALWEERATADIITLLDSLPDGPSKLRMLTQVASEMPETYGGVGVEPAIRAWARSDSEVAQAVARVDAARMAHLSGIFDQMSLTNPALPRVFYASYVGLTELSLGDGQDSIAPLTALTDLMIALSETD